jgi:hypothetical protein
MAAPKGTIPPNAGKGRKVGTLNKNTKALKDMILEALEGAHPQGGAGYLKTQAKENPAAFMTLVGKVLPLQVSGPDGDAIPISLVVEFINDPED